MNICFLGAPAAGKTTFIAALNHMQRGGSYFDLAFSETDSGRIIQAWVESLKQGNPLAPTTATLSFKGDLCFADGYKESVEFLDIVGADFENGYKQKHIPTLEQIRPFVHQCEHLFFFVEPEDILSPDSRALITFVDVLSDYMNENGRKPASVTVVMTKADLYSGLDEDDPKAVKQFVSSRHADDVNGLCQFVPSVRFVPVSVKREGAFCLTNRDFDRIFRPIRIAPFISGLRKMLLWGLCLLALVAVLTVAYEVYDRRATEVGVEKGVEANKIIETMTTADYPTLKGFYKKVEDKYPGYLPQAREAFNRRAGEIRVEAIARLKLAYVRYMSDPCPSTLDEYKKGYRYCLDVNASIPPELVLPERAMLFVYVNSILKRNHSPRETLSSFIQDRCALVRGYLEAKKRFGVSECKDVEIEKAMDLALYISSPNSYIISVNKLVGLPGVDEYCFTFSTARRASQMTSNESLNTGCFKGRAFYKNTFHPVKIQWNVDQPLSVALWEDGDCVAYEDRETGDKQHLPLGYFCRNYDSRMDIQDNDYSKIQVRFSTVRGDGSEKPISTDDLNDVYRYILSDDEWKKLME